MTKTEHIAKAMKLAAKIPGAKKRKQSRLVSKWADHMRAIGLRSN